MQSGAYRLLFQADFGIGASAVTLTTRFSYPAALSFSVDGAFAADNAVSLAVRFADGLAVLSSAAPCTATLNMSNASAANSPQAAGYAFSRQFASCPVNGTVTFGAADVAQAALWNYYASVNDPDAAPAFYVVQNLNTVVFTRTAVPTSGLAAWAIALIVIAVLLVAAGVVVAVLYVLHRKGVVDLGCMFECRCRERRAAPGGRGTQRCPDGRGTRVIVAGSGNSLYKYSIRR